MPRALWYKAWNDVWWSALACSLLLYFFAWLFVWMSSMINFNGLAMLLGAAMFEFIERIAGVPIASLSTPAGKMAFLYLDAVVLVTCLGWGIARGSDVVSGEISRGTMELLLGQPVSRASILGISSIVTCGGLLVLCLSLWLGMATGFALIDMPRKPEMAQFWPPTFNLFSYVFCVTGISTLFSSFQRERWHTIASTVGFFLVSLIIKVVGRAWKRGDWLVYFSIQGAFEPQTLIAHPETSWSLSLQFGAILIGLGLAAHLLAAVIFTYRDIPAPS